MDAWRRLDARRDSYPSTGFTDISLSLCSHTYTCTHIYTYIGIRVNSSTYSTVRRGRSGAVSTELVWRREGELTALKEGKERLLVVPSPVPDLR